MDFDHDHATVNPLAQDGSLPLCDNWRAYPQNLYGNWTPDQVARSKMLTTCSDSDSDTRCVIYTTDVFDDNGCFDKSAAQRTYVVTARTAEKFWETLPQLVRISILHLILC